MNFESLVTTWSVPDEYSCLKEELHFIHYDEDVIFKVLNINDGYQLKQIA
jgi:hypothetical protein